MRDYGVADVERLLRIPRRTLKALVSAGFVKPARGARNAWRFSFQDLVVLRTAQALVAAEIPQRRILRALSRLRRELPESMPLSGLNIGAIANQVVVREGGVARDAESGQYLLGLDETKPGSDSGFRTVAPVAQAAEPESDPDFDLEDRIEKALALHEAGELDAALREYHGALQSCGEEPTLLFNIGVLLEDMGHDPQSALLYEAAIRHDPALADAHYNLALVYERLGKGREAIRHMAQYRRLTRPTRR